MFWWPTNAIAKNSNLFDVEKEFRGNTPDTREITHHRNANHEHLMDFNMIFGRAKSARGDVKCEIYCRTHFGQFVFRQHHTNM